MNLTLEQLPQLSQKILDILPAGGIVILQGNLSSGKTTFTQSFARFLGLSDTVTSPTFSLQQRYGDSLFHYDIYNCGFDKFRTLGMMEELEKPGYHLIEWGDEELIGFVKRAGFETVTVKITQKNEIMRCYEVNHE
jgi:tRNA threonylcarbamoyladenosine biosynthesis protein TsaE